MDQINQNESRRIKMNQMDQDGSIGIKMDQIGSKLIKINQNQSKSI